MRNGGMHLAVRQQVKMMWLKGYAPERICRLPRMPNSPSTIYRWIREDNWWAELHELRDKVDEEFKQNMLDRFEQAMREHLNLLKRLGKQINVSLKSEKCLRPKEINQLATALEKMVRTEKLIRSELVSKPESERNPIMELLLGVAEVQEREDTLGF